VSYRIVRTSTENPDFKRLILRLDNEFWNELDQDRSTYEHLNQVPNLDTAVLVYIADEAVGCGCFREIDPPPSPGRVEIKRMFVEKPFRGQSLSRKILEELERWAIERGHTEARLETSADFDRAITLYKTHGYVETEQYGPYVGNPDSVCLKKELKAGVEVRG
jgi:putative acetyltransferase